jgi:hypothetical protein
MQRGIRSNSQATFSFKRIQDSYRRTCEENSRALNAITFRLTNSCPRCASNYRALISGDWKFVLAFRWLGSKEAELLAAWMAATAYAQATDGVILDGEEGKVFTPVEGRQLVHDLGHP